MAKDDANANANAKDADAVDTNRDDDVETYTADHPHTHQNGHDYQQRDDRRRVARDSQDSFPMESSSHGCCDPMGDERTTKDFGTAGEERKYHDEDDDDDDADATVS
jgi:hypothetical protein